MSLSKIVEQFPWRVVIVFERHDESQRRFRCMLYDWPSGPQPLVWSDSYPSYRRSEPRPAVCGDVVVWNHNANNALFVTDRNQNSKIKSTNKTQQIFDKNIANLTRTYQDSYGKQRRNFERSLGKTTKVWRNHGRTTTLFKATNLKTCPVCLHCPRAHSLPSDFHGAHAFNSLSIWITGFKEKSCYSTGKHVLGTNNFDGVQQNFSLEVIRWISHISQNPKVHHYVFHVKNNNQICQDL